MAITATHGGMEADLLEKVAAKGASFSGPGQVRDHVAIGKAVRHLREAIRDVRR